MTSLKKFKLNDYFTSCEKVKVEAGEAIANPNEFTKYVYRIKYGSCRILYSSLEKKGVLTYKILRKGEFIGLSNILFAEPCERVCAAEDTILEAIDTSKITSKLVDDSDLLKEILDLEHWAIGIKTVTLFITQNTKSSSNTDKYLNTLVANGRLQRVDANSNNFNDQLIRLKANHHFESIGSIYNDAEASSSNSSLNIPALIWSLPKKFLQHDYENSEYIANSKLIASKGSSNVAPDAYSLGIRSYEDSRLSERFPERYSSMGALSIIEMLSLRFQIAFRKDVIQKRIITMNKSNKSFDSSSIAKLCIATGLDARPAKAKVSDIRQILTPFILIRESVPCLIHSIEGSKINFGDGVSPLKSSELETFFSDEDTLEFVQVKKRTASTTDIFGWSWVLGIVKKYRSSLILVVIISLMAQLFSLGTPLLLQQLIDKVLSQGNTSSLNILASLMIVFALFQSILTALRSFLFVDTTDRIDLTLGSSIIDRLLQLPLGFYEKRPIGELSQRVNEMNTIRNFLTGTAITTFLDLVFSSIYLVVMLSYSPSLTAIALSTFPIYLGITIFVAPIYRQQLKTRAEAQAATQAHLIETLGGIQTVKAQHGELRARWKWQNRYQTFVEQGYKSVVLGTSTGQVGSFLNTLSSLLILWFGLRMVLDGEFTLGQLLAFRIFASYVTQPLLRVSNLWQGMQKVNLSMERLADIVNQETEAGDLDDEKTSLPPIEGNVYIEDLSFSFNNGKTMQLQDVNISVDQGEFIGVVGMSGSGKSTLMKLLSRLYSPQKGRIFIDSTDISKVQLSSLRSQIGLVPQDGVLFEGSVTDNIALNDSSISQEEIIRAAKLACAHDFIMDLPQGYATRVSEKGSNFSGGQRQRLAIARMLVESPSMLIMDEATSALDADTERKVCRNLMEVMSGKTVFFVTHRMATIMRADRVIVMDKGYVAEVGSPSELIERDGIFASLWNQQR